MIDVFIELNGVFTPHLDQNYKSPKRTFKVFPNLSKFKSKSPLGTKTSIY